MCHKKKKWSLYLFLLPVWLSHSPLSHLAPLCSVWGCWPSACSPPLLWTAAQTHCLDGCKSNEDWSYWSYNTAIPCPDACFLQADCLTYIVPAELQHGPDQSELLVDLLALQVWEDFFEAVPDAVHGHVSAEDDAEGEHVEEDASLHGQLLVAWCCFLLWHSMLESSVVEIHLINLERRTTINGLSLSCSVLSVETKYHWLSKKEVEMTQNL